MSALKIEYICHEPKVAKVIGWAESKGRIADIFVGMFEIKFASVNTT